MWGPQNGKFLICNSSYSTKHKKRNETLKGHLICPFRLSSCLCLKQEYIGREREKKRGRWRRKEEEEKEKKEEGENMNLVAGGGECISGGEARRQM